MLYVYSSLNLALYSSNHSDIFTNEYPFTSNASIIFGNASIVCMSSRICMTITLPGFTSPCGARASAPKSWAGRSSAPRQGRGPTTAGAAGGVRNRRSKPRASSSPIIRGSRWSSTTARASISWMLPLPMSSPRRPPPLTAEMSASAADLRWSDSSLRPASSTSCTSPSSRSPSAAEPGSGKDSKAWRRITRSRTSPQPAV